MSEPSTIFIVDDEKPCVQCGKPTRYIDYCSEVRLCSKECQDLFYLEMQSGIDD